MQKVHWRMRCSGKIHWSRNKNCSLVFGVSTTTSWLSSIPLWKKSCLFFTQSRRSARVQNYFVDIGNSSEVQSTAKHSQLRLCPHWASLISVPDSTTPRPTLGPPLLEPCSYQREGECANKWVNPETAFVKPQIVLSQTREVVSFLSN